jgi:hypothetical protein
VVFAFHFIGLQDIHLQSTVTTRFQLKIGKERREYPKDFRASDAEAG